MDFAFPAPLFKRFFYLTLVTILAFIVYSYVPDVHRMWVVWTALGLALVVVGNTFGRRVFLVAITGLWISVTVLISGLMALYPSFLLPFLFLFTLLCSYFAYARPPWRYLYTLVNFFVLVAIAYPHYLSHSLDRMAYAAVGVAIPLLMLMIYWPHFLRNEVRITLIRTLNNYRLLNKDIFACFIRPEYPDNLYLFERRIHQQKKRCMMARNHFNDLTRVTLLKVSDKQQEILQEINQQIAVMYDLMLDYSLLRHRVKDHTTFELILPELQGLELAIEDAYQKAINLFLHHKSVPTHTLEDKIRALENNMQQVLQIAAREPLAFELFIFSISQTQKQFEILFNLSQRTTKLLGEK